MRSSMFQNIGIIFINNILYQNEIKYAVCEKILNDLNIRKSDTKHINDTKFADKSNLIEKEMNQIITENLQYCLVSQLIFDQLTTF
jgi:hypothetical protein